MCTTPTEEKAALSGECRFQIHMIPDSIHKNSRIEPGSLFKKVGKGKNSVWKLGCFCLLEKTICSQQNGYKFCFGDYQNT